MKVDDWCLWLDTPGRQLNLSVLLGVISAVCFFLPDIFNEFNPYFTAVMKGVAGFLAVYLAGYSILLGSQLLKKRYK